ncbi:hypothetical protein [Labrys neptuniae]
MRNLAIGLISASLLTPAWASDFCQPSPPHQPPHRVRPKLLRHELYLDDRDQRKERNLPAAAINLSVRGVLKELNGAMMASLEMHVGRWGFLVDGRFFQVTSTSTLPGPFFSSVKLRSQTTTVQGLVLHSV